jgi:hypothetical protein
MGYGLHGNPREDIPPGLSAMMLPEIQIDCLADHPELVAQPAVVPPLRDYGRDRKFVGLFSPRIGGSQVAPARCDCAYAPLNPMPFYAS